MIFAYLFIGFILAALGGAFPGASNIAVIATTVKQKPNNGLQIAFGASLGEVFVAFLALSYSMLASHFLDMNMWIKSAFAIVFLAVGALFLVKHRLPKKSAKSLKNKSLPARVLKGFVLGAVNPPVLLFWLLSIALVNNNITPLSNMLGVGSLLLFFIGVFLGKLLILVLYGHTGKKLLQSNQNTNSTHTLNKAIGLALISIAVIQAFRVWVI